MNHDGIFYTVSILLPDLTVDFFGREHVAGMLHQKLHNFVLGCGQADRFAVHQEFFGVSVQQQTAVFQDILVWHGSVCGA